MNKIVITVVGKDTVGIVAAVCTYLAENHINILDITQTILQDFFNMMMIVDVTKMEKTFDEMAKELAAVGEKKGVKVICQREEIFTSMHRL
ncbi:MAG: ACT domain-containing protein [Clostridium sp.]|nr:ACT domain-containing protein [Clostridium sp.]